MDLSILFSPLCTIGCVRSEGFGVACSIPGCRFVFRGLQMRAGLVSWLFWDGCIVGFEMYCSYVGQVIRGMVLSEGHGRFLLRETGNDRLRLAYDGPGN